LWYGGHLNARIVRTAAYWIVPSLLCLILYWPGLLTWFQDDDFAFLALKANIHNWHDLLGILTHPTPGGSWRPFSDRGYYLLLQTLFGSNPLPFHIVCFLTQFANLALISALTRRLTGSSVAGFLAPVLWIANSKLIIVMTWCLAYDYTLCGFSLLTAFWLFLRWIETADRRYYAGMWAVFLLGFGVLETNIVFPLLAASYTLLCVRSYFRKTIPLFVPSIIFIAAHMLLIHAPATGPYSLHVNAAMIKTFGHYWAWAFEPVNLTAFTHLPESVGVCGMLLFSGALLGFAVHEAYRRNLVPLFFLCWFAIVLAPDLPLRDNVTDFYLALPCIGIAMLAAYAFAFAWKKRAVYKGIAVILLAFFLSESIPTANGGAEWYLRRSLKVEALVRAVVAEHALYPGKTILLEGIDRAQFAASVAQHAFAAFGVPNVFLVPGSDAEIAPRNPAAVARFVLPADRTEEVLAHRAGVVLELRDGQWTDITTQYSPPQQHPEGTAATAKSRRVDAGDPRYQNQLGSEWYAIDLGFRWMPKRASVRLLGPVVKGQTLIVSGYCPAVQVAEGPLGMEVSVDGTALRSVKIVKGDAPFTFEFTLPDDARQQIIVEVEVERTFSTTADRRNLGLAFGVFEIR
jgi:hypothetical protein